jgi:5-formyltetrahydrofolate cyclo-ligase
LTSPGNDKKKQRTHALNARRSLTREERNNGSARICERLVRSHEFMSARMIACYLPTIDEVDPTAIIERAWCANKRVFVPVTDTHSVMNFCEVTSDTVVARNDYGIWEPLSGTFIDAKSLDLVVTPVVAFDANKNRIGMGGGYYDRCFHFLRNRRKWLKPKLIGVAFACQQVKNITPETWDIPFYKVVTDVR